MRVHFLRAEHGDSIFITLTDPYGQDRNILIDGGTGATYQMAKSKKGTEEEPALHAAVLNLDPCGPVIDLLILTHVDDDHIGGLLTWFESDDTALSLIKEVWFNSGKLISAYFSSDEIEGSDIILNQDSGSATGIAQGVSFAGLLEGKGLLYSHVLKSMMTLERFGATFRMLSPNEKKLRALLNKWEKEAPSSLTSDSNDHSLSLEELSKDMSFSQDKDRHNGSSISFILDYGETSLVFLADSHPSVIIESLRAMGYSADKPLDATFVKVSHHGSNANTNNELLSLIRCENFIISTDGSRHGHPSKKVIACIIKSNGNRNIPCTIYFNYPELIDKIFTPEDYEAYPFFSAQPTTNKTEY